MVRVGGDQALVFTMRELGQQAAHLMAEIEKGGKPAFITRHGRFVAVITPLAPGQLGTTSPG
jgi:prevent-host-death family protein